ncbi:MAG TPA: hypothetical protein VL401_03240 [Alphaproteobacteria bacterium]|jgi:hypothetical protein|nr:hypothetical protein [Alphaproteobacteria bacterium]
MKIVKKISEDEMIAAFLKAEINSDRFGSGISSLLEKHTLDRKILDTPDLENKLENSFRKEILGEARGFGKNLHIFTNFPSNIEWFRVLISKSELEKILYINWNYWLEMTKNTRLPLDLIARIESGDLLEDKEVSRFKSVSNHIKSGVKVPEMILVAKNKNSRLVVLEGHVRLTAYLLDTKDVPEEMEVIIGFSNDIEKWGMY